MNEQKTAFLLYAACALVLFNILLFQIIGYPLNPLFIFGWLLCIVLSGIFVLIEEKWKEDKKRDVYNNS